MSVVSFQEASKKLLKAEKDRLIIEEKVKLWKKPVGLARPVEPKVNPLITHRGHGAFCDRDFLRKPSVDDANKTDEETDEKDDIQGKVDDENHVFEETEDNSKNEETVEAAFTNKTESGGGNKTDSERSVSATSDTSAEAETDHATGDVIVKPTDDSNRASPEHESPITTNGDSDTANEVQPELSQQDQDGSKDVNDNDRADTKINDIGMDDVETQNGDLIEIVDT